MKKHMKMANMLSVILFHQMLQRNYVTPNCLNYISLYAWEKVQKIQSYFKLYLIFYFYCQFATMTSKSGSGTGSGTGSTSLTFVDRQREKSSDVQEEGGSIYKGSEISVKQVRFEFLSLKQINF